MIGKIIDFGSSLRFSGLSVSIPETLEVASLLQQMEPIESKEKEQIRLFLQACMLKNEDYANVFQEQFDRWWARWFREPPAKADFSSLIASLREAILAGDKEEIEKLFHLALSTAMAEMEEGNALPGQGAGAGGAGGAGGGDGNNPIFRAKGRRAVYDHLRGMLDFEQLSQEIETDDQLSLWKRQNAETSLKRAEMLLRQAVFSSGHNQGDRHVRQMRLRMQDTPEELSDLEIYKATYSQVQKMQKIVPDIVRQLLFKKKYQDHREKGTLNLRKTLRKSLSHGGVPTDIIFKRKIPKRERIAIFCDMSSSVAVFSQFALQLANCFSSQFAGITSYGFISDIDDITRFVSRDDFPRSLEDVYSECDLVLGSSNSDYGQVFQQFVKKHLHDLPRSASVIILGDARNNGRDPQLESLKTIKNWVQKVYWLNPEPESSWGYGDSVMDEYAKLCDVTQHIATVNDLAEFVDSLRENRSNPF